MALFNSFTFGDVNSEDYGVYISGDSVYDSPARSVDLVQVPGRNGALALDNGYYENIEVTYPAGSFGTSQEEWREKMLGIRNALAAQRGYQKLIDTYHPEHYRLGMFFAGISASPVQYNRAGQFPIRFNCKPQRFLISGDEAVEFTAEGQEEVYGPASIASFEIEEGEEIREAVVNLEPIQNLNGQTSPYPAGGSHNLFKVTPYSGTYAGAVGADLKKGTGMPYSIMSDGRVQVDVTTAWKYRCFATDALAAGTYTVRSYADKTSVRATAYQTDGNLIVKAVKYNHQSAGWATAQTFAVEEGDRIAICIGANAVATLITEFQVNAGSTIADIVPFENICPITGHTEVNVTRTGKNLLNVTVAGVKSANGGASSWSGNTKVIGGVTYTLLEDADGNLIGIRANGTSSSSYAYLYLTQNCTVAKDSEYVISGSPTGASGSTYRIFCDSTTAFPPGNRLSDDSAVNSKRTARADESFPVFIQIYGHVSVNNVTFYPMIRFSSVTDATYEPYVGQTYNVPLGQTVYGGTLNVTSGLLTITHYNLDMGSRNWSYSGTSGVEYFYMFLPYAAKSKLSAEYLNNAVCSMYKQVGYDAVNGQNSTFGINGAGTLLKVCDLAYTDAATFKTAMNGVQLCYELATPTTVQLTPTQVSTLLGQNNIWADSGEVEVKVASPVDLTNPTNFPAKPLIRVYGNGSVRVGNTIATVQNNADGYVDIDCESMNCYDPTGGRNADVSFSGNDFPELASGDNGILLTGPSKVEITPRWWEL